MWDRCSGLSQHLVGQIGGTTYMLISLWVHLSLLPPFASDNLPLTPKYYLGYSVMSLCDMCSSSLSDTQPTSPLTIPPLPHKWLTCAYIVCCLVVISLDPPCWQVHNHHLHQGPYYGPEATCWHAPPALPCNHRYRCQPRHGCMWTQVLGIFLFSFAISLCGGVSWPRVNWGMYK